MIRPSFSFHVQLHVHRNLVSVATSQTDLDAVLPSQMPKEDLGSQNIQSTFKCELKMRVPRESMPKNILPEMTIFYNLAALF